MDGLNDGCRDKRREVGMDGRMDGRMDRERYRWMDGWREEGRQGVRKSMGSEGWRGGCWDGFHCFALDWLRAIGSLTELGVEERGRAERRRRRGRGG